MIRAIMLGLALLALPGGPAQAAGRGSGLFAQARTVLPGEAIRSVVVVFSDGPWRAGDSRRLGDLRARGAAVIGVDTAALLARIEADPGACVYVMAAVEDLAKSMQRGMADGAYRQPLLAGQGLGGTMALALMAQTPPGTVEGAVAADPAAGLPLVKPLCTQAERVVAEGVARYGLSPGPLPAPLEVLLTPDTPPAGRALAEGLRAAHPDIALTAAAPGDALGRALADRLGTAQADPLGLPLTLLPAPVRHGAMAVIYSGDGGWRDIDKQIGNALAREGVPVVGVDSLRYFWQERTPEATAADLARIIAAYGAEWRAPKVALIGYSFGADILPATYSHLPPEAKAKVAQISLLGLSHTAAWEISVGGWLGQEGEGPQTAPDIARIDSALLQCFHGTEEEESPCPALAATGVEVFSRPGGHHFDGNYEALAQDVLDGLDRRLGR